MMPMLRAVTGVVVLVAGCLLVGTAGGCRKQPFMEDVPRSPYVRYMELRGRERPAMQRNQFGIVERNARERLQPLEQ